MKVTDLQNTYDVTLQAYGTLDQAVKLAADNGFDLDETPPVGQTVLFDETIGERRVKVYTTENDHVFNNEAIQAKTALLAADNIALSPVLDVIFIYK